MRKRLTSILLTLAMLVGLLPALSPQAEASTGVAIVDVYSLADIKSAANQDQVRIIRLMKDIDASKENVTYDGDGFNTNSAIGRLASGCVLNGNGHTIYNLRGPLFANNMGNIHDLNVTLVHSDENSDIFAPGGYPLLSGIASWNDYRGVGGVIENCTVTMNVKRDFGNVGGDWLSIDGISQGGTIRNCIAKLNIDLKLDSNAYGGISVRGIGFGYNNSLTDHCLVLGSVKITSPQSSNADAYFTGISDGTTQDSACALDTLSITAKSARNDPYEHFTLGSGSEGTGTRNRAASDMNVNYTFNNRILLSGTPTTASGNYTLDTRPNILKDWDLSVLPDTEPTTTPDSEPKPEPEPKPAEPSFSKGTVEFHFEGTCEDTRSWQFDYDDSFFYEQDNGYGYNAKLAKASLCLEMASFTTNAGPTWSGDGRSNPSIVLSRTENIRELLIELGFDSLEYMNYDVPLNDTSDKVAYYMAMKYITNENGGTDTLIAVPIRGGGYGGEWASNFHVYGNTNTLSNNHYGFQTAAEGVLNGLSDYVKSHEIKGDLKIWAVGYSRGAAVANLLGRMLNNAKLGGIKPNVADIYVYTFATPAGAFRVSAETFYDPNIFNIVSSVDLVPHVAPGAWNYTRYGTTLTLPYDSNSTLWNKFEEISGEKTSGIKPSQRTLIDQFCQKAFTSNPSTGNGVFGKTSYSSIQQEIMNFTGDALGAPPSNATNSPTSTHDPIKTYKIIGTLRCVLSDAAMRKLLSYAALDNDTPLLAVIPTLSTIGLAHCPEHYLARLETDNLQDEGDFYTSTHARSVLMYPPADKQLKTYNIKVDFWNAGGQSAGSYANGVCKSGDVTVEMTDIGLIATLPADGDYTFTVSGADAAKVSVTFYAYEGGELEPTRDETFDRLPVSDGSSCTVFVPESSYDDFYAEDADGYAYYPGDDIDSIYTPETPVSMNFTDVPESAYFYEPVLWAVENGVTSGTSATKFSPYEGCTRGQVVTFLWRAAGCPEPESSYNPFSDVPSNAYYHDAVLWAAEEGITTGTSRTRFEPNATVTRAQTVTFLWRWAGSPEPGSAGSFRDVSRSAYYADAVAWAVEYGITNGTAPGLFSPAQTCTRAQIVTFLYRDLAAEWEDYET